jgi:hypothetical protein
MKIYKRSLLATILFASTLLFATSTSNIVSEDKVSEEMLNSQEVNDIVDLVATSTNGLSVCNFRIKSLPSTESGELYMADGVTLVEENQNLTRNEANGLMFDPKDGFVGNAIFTYVGLDVNGDEGSIGKVTVPVVASDSNGANNGENGNDNGAGNDNSGVSSVTTDDKTNPEMLNSLPAVDILDLSGTDVNGAVIDNFIIKSLPDTASGLLYMEDGITAVEVDQNLTKDESSGLKFDPQEDFVGDALFTYQSVDVNGDLGNVATVTIPVVSTLNPDNNGSVSADCECNDYNKSIPVLSNFGILLMLMLTSLVGLFFTRKEI